MNKQILRVTGLVVLAMDTLFLLLYVIPSPSFIKDMVFWIGITLGFFLLILSSRKIMARLENLARVMNGREGH